jgi:hypothetical protein
MSLLPPQFQTTLPGLGAKVVAIAPAPAPHAHQWVPVPDSKIHSRCAECGSVTLTEIVAPKPAFASTTACDDQFRPFAFIPNEGLTELWQSVMAQIDKAVSVGSIYAYAPPSFFPVGGSTGVDLASVGAAEYTAITDPRKVVRAPAPRYYQSITTPVGLVTMVETDAEGWVAYPGSGQPVSDDTEVEIRFYDGSEDQYRASFAFTGDTAAIIRWRLARAEDGGWIENTGVQPVGDRDRVEVRVNGRERPADKAINFNWGHPTFTHWRLAK